ncbi:hypothetical protein [Pseudomonas rossensis]|uniref:hypothetical protein n=1 Tax=Pseudomonas rossensis TaxID=2305471 RepID=UPI0032600380
MVRETAFNEFAIVTRRLNRTRSNQAGEPRAGYAGALVALVALMFWKLPPWLVVVGCGVAGWLLSVLL